MKKLLPLLLILQSLQLHAQWRTIFRGTDSLNNIVSASYFSATSGFIATNKWIGYTTDSGYSFQHRSIGNGNVNYGLNSVNLTFGFSPSDVQAFDNNTLLVSGNYGFEPSVLSSVDGGNSWTLAYHKNLPGTDGSSNSVYQMSFPGGGSTGYAIQNNEIIKTTNKGQSWQTVSAASGLGFFTISFTSATTGYAAGANILLKTTNGGANWSTVTGPFVIQAMTAVSDLHVYVITTRGDCYSSTDGGVSWQQANTLTGRLDAGIVNSIHFVNDSVGYIAGSIIYQTRNRGKSWEMMSSSSALVNYYVGYARMFFLNNQQAWAAGAGETLLLTRNGGGATVPRALFDVNTDNVCTSSTVQLVNQSQPGYTYSWYKNNVLFASTYNASYTTSGGNDVIRLIVSNGMLSDTSVQTVNASAATGIVLNSAPRQDSTCSGGTLYFDIFNSQAGVQYQVRRSCCFVSSLIPGNGGTISISTPLNAGEDSTSTFTVYATKTGPCGTQTAQQSHLVRIFLSNPATTTVTDTVCVQGVFGVRIPHSLVGYQYWIDPSKPAVKGTGDTISVPCTMGLAKSSSALTPDNLLMQYHFSVFVAHINPGCSGPAIADAVMVGRSVSVNFGIHGYTWFTGDTIQFINASKQASSYLWRAGDGAAFATSTLPVAPISYLTGGYKHISLLAYTKEGCVDSMEQVVTVLGKDATVASTNICPGSSGNIVDSVKPGPLYSGFYVDRALYEDEKGGRVMAGGYTGGGYPTGLEGWWAVKHDKNGQLLWHLSQVELDFYHTYQNYPHIVIEQAAGDSSGNTYLLGHAVNQQYVTATGESQTAIASMADFLIKVSAAGHIVWVKPFYSNDPGYGPYNFYCGGSLLRGKDNTLYVVTQRYPGSQYTAGGTTVFNAGEGQTGVIMQFDMDGNLLRKNSFLCPPVNLWTGYIGSTDNYWHTPPASWANGKLVIYTTLYPGQGMLENATISFSASQIPSALAVFDTSTLHAVRVLPVFNNLSGSAAGMAAEAYAMDSTGAYYASFNGKVPIPAPAYPYNEFPDTLKGVSYIEAFDASGNLRWTKIADGLDARSMVASSGQLKVCGTNYASSGWTTGGMIAIGVQGPTDASVKKLTEIGDIGSLAGEGGHGIGSLDIVVATLQTSNGQMIDYLPLGSTFEDEWMVMAKGAGNQLWVAGSVGTRWRDLGNAGSYGVYTYKLPVTNDCYGGYPNQAPFLKLSVAPTAVVCTDSLYTVSWSSSGTGSLDLSYSLDNGANYTSLAAGLSPSAYSYTFNAKQKGLLGQVLFMIKDDSSALQDSGSRQINLNINPAVALSASDTSICQGAPVQFRTTVTNGGLTPSYQWLVGQQVVADVTDTFTVNTLNDKDKIQVKVTGSFVCSTVANSNILTIRVIADTVPSVHLSGNTIVRPGLTDTLYASAVGAGMAPSSFSYRWQDSTAAHGWTIVPGLTDSVALYIPAAVGDGLRCIVISHALCSVPDSAISNVAVFGQPSYLRLRAGTGNVVCADSLYTLSWSSYGTGLLNLLYSTDSGGHYSMLVSGLSPSVNSYAYDLRRYATGRLLFVIRDSASSLQDSSTREVYLNVHPGVKLAATDTVVCQGAAMQFIATPVHGGTAPSYQWLLNQSVVGGAVGDTLVLSVINNGDKVQVQVTSNAVCSAAGFVVSNAVTMTVAADTVPTVNINGHTLVNQGQRDTLFALASSAGIAPTYQWQDSTAGHGWKVIAGQVSSTCYYLPIASGDKIRCMVTSHAACSNPDSAISRPVTFLVIVPPIVAQPPPPIVVVDSSVSAHLFPNPAFTLVVLDSLKTEDEWTNLDIINISGDKKITGIRIDNQTQVSVPIGGLPKGVYFIHIYGTKKSAYLQMLKL